jgi:hypothetical protein
VGKDDGVDMANTLLTCSQITNEALKVLEDEMGFDWLDPAQRVIHMEGKNRWQILEYAGSNKYRVIADHLTHKEAQALLKIY